MKKFICVLCALCVLLGAATLPAGAISFSNNVVTRSKSILMVNRDIGQVVFEQDADEKRYPASTTKIMTYIVAYEHIDDIENTRIPIRTSTAKSRAMATANSRCDARTTLNRIMHSPPAALHEPIYEPGLGLITGGFALHAQNAIPGQKICNRREEALCEAPLRRDVKNERGFL